MSRKENRKKIYTLFCNGYLEKDPHTPSVHGVNITFNPDRRPFKVFAKDIQLAVDHGFNVIRLPLVQPYQIQHLDKIIALVQKHNIAVLPQIFHGESIHNRHSFSLQKGLIDLLVEKLDRFVHAWDLCNEPGAGRSGENLQGAYYTRVEELCKYLRSLTRKPITIGFHQRFLRIIERLAQLCDILSYHVYANYTVSVEKKDPYKAFTDRLAWFSKFGKPLLISEWNIGQVNSGYLEDLQRCYCANILHIIKENSELCTGYCFFQLRDWGGRYWGLLREDCSAKLALKLFP